MIKGKEGIALVLAIVFMLAITILLTAVLLLSTQEINATQLYLDGNKAFYYAEAGVEYAQARILKADESGTLNDNFLSELSNSSTDNYLKSSFNDTNVKNVDLTVVRGSSAHTYRMSCEVKYNKTTRKITKEIRILYPGLWDKAMASDGNITLTVTPGQNGSITINGDIHSNQNITYTTNGVTINGDITACGKINNVLNNAPPLNIPIIDLDFYKSLTPSRNIFQSGDDFLDALKFGALDMSNKPTYVYIKADKGGWDFKLENLRQDLIVSDICIVVDGNLKFNNTKSTITVGSDSYMISFIVTGKLDFTNIKNDTTFKNTLFYSQTQIDFTNIPGSVTINGAMYSKNGYIGLDTIKAPLTINHVKWSYSDVSHLFDLYQVESWSDASV